MESGFVRFLNNKKKRDTEKNTIKVKESEIKKQKAIQAQRNTQVDKPQSQSDDLTNNDGNLKALIFKNSGKIFSPTPTPTQTPVPTPVPVTTKPSPTTQTPSSPSTNPPLYTIQITKIPSNTDKNSLKRFLFEHLNGESIVSYKRLKEENKLKILIQTIQEPSRLPSKLIYNNSILKLKKL